MASLILCAVSQTPAENPVVSIKSGLVFEKSVIEKYIDINGRCPITGEPLESADLVPIRSIFWTNAAPISPLPQVPSLKQSTVPELIHRLKDDWDNVAIETNTLKQYVHKLRKELSHVLYQQDASCRVIARLLKERDEARK